LLQENATVTVCHSYTTELGEETKRADFLVSAVGRAGVVQDWMVKPGAVVLDCGSNFVEDPVTKKRKTVGDVDFDAAKEKAEAITPVPGGVGPMLVTMLMANTVLSAKMAAGLA